ncbi:Phage integrase [Burkholderia pseudomallei]|uniref:tyrosine-type recombinase/integrase n=1 Tax=Burkholderia pseudomallei TaxID=28450 RepID=UPI000F05D28A|nr:integrase family protein [Burkholderia pseudomallei]CAJ5233009.1 Phage integrase [Burkholderia pseudomallei]CAJ7566059.1 Phage integrase [Burkholderia pseudomallei]CAK0348899.1 Phage integrase [Burkholderia pseudomallei]VCH22775.1 Phage integrase [Burkholderia pseudomallei]VCH61721.1 Phage integrase [Burkholderia pseudomallei]
MSKQNFTAARVESFQCEPGKQQTIYWDAKTAGFGLRVTAAGARAYIFESRLFGKTVRVTIGDARAWDLGRARTEAARLRTLIDDGKDPREVRAEQQVAHEARRAEARRHDLLVLEAWQQYLEMRKDKWSERHYLDHQRLSEVGGRQAKKGGRQIVAGPLAPLMALRLSELTRETVDSWLAEEVKARPARARLAFSLLRAFITWSQEQPDYAGLAASEVCTNKRIREHLPKPATKADCLQREQLIAWFRAVRNAANPIISAYLQGLLITGARREEWAGLRWEDVDFRWRSLVLDDKVEGTGGRTIPLTPYLATLLMNLKLLNETPPDRRQLARLKERGETWAPSEWVFSSKTSEDGKIAEPRIAHNKALAEAELPHVTLHGLRRSFGTLSEWVEVPVGVVAQIQGHKPSAIAEKHYRRRPLDLLRMWHDKIESWMLEQAGIQFQVDAA